MSVPSTSQPARKPRTRRGRGPASLSAHGEPAIWMAGGALAVAGGMIFGLLLLIVIQGTATFWPGDLLLVRTVNGKLFLGEVVREETYRPEPNVLDALADHEKPADGIARRRLLRTGNYDLTGTHHHWISDFQIAEESRPEWALVIERRSNDGNFYGTPVALLIDGVATETDPQAIYDAFLAKQPEVLERIDERDRLSREEIGALSRRENDARLEVRQAEISHGKGSPQEAEAKKRYEAVKNDCTLQREQLSARIAGLDKENDRFQMRLLSADGRSKTLPFAAIVRAYPANQLTWDEKLGVYGSRWGEFLSAMPRAANTEGGVWPAIWGTVAMTLLMSLAVVPFGVLAALYLREYAKSGPIISAVRIAINNLAGVPSIVFGVFGMGFFCYLVGAFIDGGPRHIQVEPLPSGSWWLGLTAAVVVGTAAFCLGLAGGKSALHSPSRLELYRSRLAVLLWLASLAAILGLLCKSPYFHGFYQARLADNSPTFGTGCVLWASLTLALLTLPVVIVATEEALAAVPSSMREGSYACGASQWQTIYRIVLPRALPGIMTGMILAIARGAGEVAPIMLVGAQQMTGVPMDGEFPYLHPSRSFMHLGYQIYHVGFQSPNSEAARPMVFTTTLLLIAIIAFLNLAAVWLRARLRRRYLVSQF